MEKIKVFLRLGKRPHPSTYEIIDNPPQNVIYKYSPILRSSKEKVSLFHKLKVKIWLKYIKDKPPIIPIFPRECDLIHMTNNILNSSKNPWVTDVEHVWSLMGFKLSNFKNRKYFPKVKRILSSEYCKKLIPYTDASKQSLLNNGFKELENKIEVVYLAKKAVKDFQKIENETPVVLWMGRRFWEKGGYTVLKVFDKLDGKVDFKLIVRGPVPEYLKKKYSNKKNIEIYDSSEFSFDKTWGDMYKKADIFLYPTNLDSFGNAFLDAMNHKVPIITGDIFSAPEIVEDGVNGFVVKHPMKWHDENFKLIYPSFEDYINKLKTFNDDKYFSELAKKVMILIKDKNLRKRMGIAGRKMVEKGKFSIEERNKKFERIYREAIN